MNDAADIAALRFPGDDLADGTGDEYLAEVEGGLLSVEEVSALSVLGHVMLDHNELADALAIFEALVVLAPEHGYAHRMLVYVHLRAGEHAQALTAAESYRRLPFGDELGNTVLTLLESKALWGLGRKAEARERLQHYLEMSATL